MLHTVFYAVSEIAFHALHIVACFFVHILLRMMLALIITSVAYAPPGLLAGLVEMKEREVAQMKKLPEAREDGPWALRLAYPAAKSSYVLARALGWREERPAVLIDLKRSSPGEQLGETERIHEELNVAATVGELQKLGATAALVSTDLPSWGGSWRDLRDAADATKARTLTGAPPLPIVTKDLIIDPIQIARAACEGAHAVLLIAAACLADLPSLLDTCTLLGIEALVEVHTPEELRVAVECGASLLLVNDRDRATGKLVSGQAVSLAPAIPPDAVCLACGGIRRVDQVRTLRRAGYDGVVIGRSFSPAATVSQPSFLEQLLQEEARPRIVEVVSVTRTGFMDEEAADSSFSP